MIIDAGDTNNWGAWVGGRRRHQCIAGYDNSHPYDPNINDPCSMINNFEWENGVAVGFPAELWIIELNPSNNRAEKNPNYMNQPDCVALVLRTSAFMVAVPENKGYLDDVACDYYKRTFFCQITLTGTEVYE